MILSQAQIVSRVKPKRKRILPPEFRSYPADHAHAASRMGFSVTLVSADGHHTPYPLVADPETKRIYAVIPANTEYEIGVKAPAPNKGNFISEHNTIQRDTTSTAQLKTNPHPTTCSSKKCTSAV